MKYKLSWIKTTIVAAASMALGALSIQANTLITDFQNFTSDALYASWQTATITGTTNYSITATGYGSNWKAIPLIAPASDTNIEVTVDLSAADSVGASGKIGPIVTLVDSNGNEFNYAFYGQQLGHKVLTAQLSAGTRAAGTGALDITKLAGIHMQVDPSSYAGAYTIVWDKVRLFNTNDAPTDGGCVTIDDFNGSQLNGYNGGWGAGATIVSTPTNLQITATGFGDAFQAVTASTTSNLTLSLDVTLTGSDVMGPLVILQDNNGNQLKYAFYNTPVGRHVVSAPLNSGTLVSGAGPFNFKSITFIHMQLDPEGVSGQYTVAFNDLSVTGCGAAAPNGCGEMYPFDGAGLAGYFQGWATATTQVTPTNLIITATGFGDGYQAFSPAINTTSNLTLALDVTLTASDVMGPIVVLQDNGGNQIQYAFYNTTTGNHVLTAPLNSGVLQGGASSFNFANITFFHVQVDPEGVSGQYTVAFNDLSVIGCSAASSFKITSITRSGNNVTLTWSSSANQQYTILTSTTVGGSFTPLLQNIASGGTTTTQQVTFPGTQGYLKVQQQ